MQKKIIREVSSNVGITDFKDYKIAQILIVCEIPINVGITDFKDYEITPILIIHEILPSV